MKILQPEFYNQQSVFIVDTLLYLDCVKYVKFNPQNLVTA